MKQLQSVGDSDPWLEFHPKAPLLSCSCGNVPNELKDTAHLKEIIQVPDTSSGSQSVTDELVLRVDTCFMHDEHAEDLGQKLQ